MDNDNVKKDAPQQPVQKPSTNYEKSSGHAKETSHREPPKPPKKEKE